MGKKIIYMTNKVKLFINSEIPVKNVLFMIIKFDAALYEQLKQ